MTTDPGPGAQVKDRLQLLEPYIDAGQLMESTDLDSEVGAWTVPK